MKKKTNKIIVPGLFLFALFAFAPKLKAQSTYSKFYNKLDCAIKLDVEVFDAGLASCYSYAKSVDPNTEEILDYGPCATFGKIQVTLIEVDGDPTSHAIDSTDDSPVYVGVVGCASPTSNLTFYFVGPTGGRFILHK